MDLPRPRFPSPIDLSELRHPSHPSLPSKPIPMSPPIILPSNHPPDLRPFLQSAGVRLPKEIASTASSSNSKEPKQDVPEDPQQCLPANSSSLNPWWVPPPSCFPFEQSSTPSSTTPDTIPRLGPTPVEEMPKPRETVRAHTLFRRRLPNGETPTCVAVGRGLWYPDGPVYLTREGARRLRRKQRPVVESTSEFGSGKGVSGGKQQGGALKGGRGVGQGDAGKKVKEGRTLKEEEEAWKKMMREKDKWKPKVHVVVGTEEGKVVDLHPADADKDILIDTKSASITSVHLTSFFPSITLSDICTADSEGQICIMSRQRTVLREGGSGSTVGSGWASLGKLAPGAPKGWEREEVGGVGGRCVCSIGERKDGGGDGGERIMVVGDAAGSVSGYNLFMRQWKVQVGGVVPFPCVPYDSKSINCILPVVLPSKHMHPQDKSDEMEGEEEGTNYLLICDGSPRVQFMRVKDRRVAFWIQTPCEIRDMTIGHFWDNPSTSSHRVSRLQHFNLCKSKGILLPKLQPSLDRQVLLGGSNATVYLLDLDNMKLYHYLSLDYTITRLSRCRPLGLQDGDVDAVVVCTESGEVTVGFEGRVAGSVEVGDWVVGLGTGMDLANYLQQPASTTPPTPISKKEKEAYHDFVFLLYDSTLVSIRFQTPSYATLPPPTPKAPPPSKAIKRTTTIFESILKVARGEVVPPGIFSGVGDWVEGWEGREVYAAPEGLEGAVKVEDVFGGLVGADDDSGDDEGVLEEVVETRDEKAVVGTVAAAPRAPDDEEEEGEILE
ncbi:hypothetical protein HDV05_002262 [Chytridiales sp. JEL 0842]|nr:hypothetical protein HDV05_002262 [Chytridiales sp. JEL 0842]